MMHKQERVAEAIFVRQKECEEAHRHKTRTAALLHLAFLPAVAEAKWPLWIKKMTIPLIRKEESGGNDYHRFMSPSL